MGRARAILAAALLATCLLGAGCTTTAPKVTSAWPVASAEATVPAPADINKWPLSGLRAPSAASLTKPVLSVAIENATSSRPQTGLGSADVVYEWLGVNGGTELNALFQSSRPALIGPLADSGLVDPIVASQYGADPIARGTSASTGPGQAGVQSALQAPGITVSTTPRGAPEGEYLVTSKALETVPGFEAQPAPGHLQFDSAPASGGPIARVEIPFSASETVSWTYRSKTHSYVRQAAGRAQLDAASRKQISAKNVVVMWVRYTEVAGGGVSSDAALVGSGQVTVFRNGVKVDGRWRASADAPPKFTLEDGTPIDLAPGNSWLEAIPLSMNITMK